MESKPDLVINVPPSGDEKSKLLPKATYAKMKYEKVPDTGVSEVAMEGEGLNLDANSCWASFLTGCGKCCGYSCLAISCGCCCNPYQQVNIGNKGIITQFGRVRDVVQPGIHYVNPMTEKMSIVNMKVLTQSLKAQEVMTSNSLPCFIEGDIFYRRIDPVKSTFFVQDLPFSLEQLAMTSLRLVFGRYELLDCLANRSQISDEILDICMRTAGNWGVEISAIQLKDIRLPAHIRDLLASTATAQRESEALIIKSEAQVKSAQLMRAAADQLSTPGAMQIRSLDMIERLAMSQNAKLIFIPAGYGNHAPVPDNNNNNNNSNNNNNANVNFALPSINVNQ